MTKQWEPYAQHILSAIGKIEQIHQRGDFTRDEILYDAVLRNLQTLSEATQHLPDDLKMKFPDIPWRDISGFRNILVHNYLGKIDAEAVAKVVRDKLDSLATAVREMLKRQPS